MNLDATLALRPSRSHPMSDRMAATLVGVLFIVGTLAGILGRAVTRGGVFDGPDYLGEAAALGRRLPTGALLMLVMGLALALIPVVAYPVLRVASQRLALGYLVFRGALETISYLVGATTWLVLFQLGRDSAAGSGDASGLRGASAAFARFTDVIGPATTIFFLVGAVMFYWTLHRWSLVPRWLSIWGFVGIAPYLIEALLTIFAAIPPSGSTANALDAPLALQEMVLAIWLIARGFNTTATPSGTMGTEAPTTSRQSLPVS